jgi:hypothetical protein
MISDLSRRFSVTFEVDEGHGLAREASSQKLCGIINFVTFRSFHRHREHS